MAFYAKIHAGIDRFSAKWCFSNLRLILKYQVIYYRHLLASDFFLNTLTDPKYVQQ